MSLESGPKSSTAKSFCGGIDRRAERRARERRRFGGRPAQIRVAVCESCGVNAVRRRRRRGFGGDCEKGRRVNSGRTFPQIPSAQRRHCPPHVWRARIRTKPERPAAQKAPYRRRRARFRKTPLAAMPRVKRSEDASACQLYGAQFRVCGNSSLIRLGTPSVRAACLHHGAFGLPAGRVAPAHERVYCRGAVAKLQPVASNAVSRCARPDYMCCKTPAGLGDRPGRLWPQPGWKRGRARVCVYVRPPIGVIF